MNSQHTVKSFDQDLRAIEGLIAQMGGIAEKLMADSMEALTRLDLGLAQSVVEGDARLDELQRQVEEKAIVTLARRQPFAVDLREIISAIRISGDLERVGDLAKSIAKRGMKIASEPRLPRAVVGLKHMSELASRQIKDVLDAYAARDPQRAHDVWLHDAEIDALEDSVFRDLLTFMLEDPRNISFCAHLLFCSKNIERIGDHATNIAETVHFLVTGDNLPFDRPKGPGAGVNP